MRWPEQFSPLLIFLFPLLVRISPDTRANPSSTPRVPLPSTLPLAATRRHRRREHLRHRSRRLSPPHRPSRTAPVPWQEDSPRGRDAAAAIRRRSASALHRPTLPALLRPVRARLGRAEIQLAGRDPSAVALYCCLLSPPAMSGQISPSTHTSVRLLLPPPISRCLLLICCDSWMQFIEWIC